MAEELNTPAVEPVNSFASAPAPEPTPAPTPEARPEPALRDIAAGMGFDTTGFEDDRGYGLNLLREYHGSKSYADLGKEMAPHREKFQEFLKAQQNKPAEPAAPEDRFGKHWGAPKWNSQWDQAIRDGYVVQDANGSFVARPGYEAHVAGMLAPINEARAKRGEEINKLFANNPFETIYEALLPAFQEQWQKDAEEKAKGALTGYQQQQTADAAINDFSAKYGAELYANGVPTEKGKAFDAALQELQDAGMAQSPKLLAMAARLAGLSGQAPPPAAAPTPAAPAKPEPTFVERARQRAAHTANQLPQPEATPEALPGELKGFFSRSFAGSAAN